MLPQTLLPLFHLMFNSSNVGHFVLELNSKGLYESSGKAKESFSSCVPVLDKT